MPDTMRLVSRKSRSGVFEEAGVARVRIVMSSPYTASGKNGPVRKDDWSVVAHALSRDAAEAELQRKWCEERRLVQLQVNEEPGTEDVVVGNYRATGMSRTGMILEWVGDVRPVPPVFAARLTKK